jgi:hypothetical protein
VECKVHVDEEYRKQVGEEDIFSDDVTDCQSDVRLMVFMMVKINVDLFRIVTSCNVAVGYQHFGGPCSLHLNPTDLDSDCQSIYLSGNSCPLASYKVANPGDPIGA